MRILLTNDDGIRAPGIAAMFDELIDAHGRHGGPVRDPAGHAPCPNSSCPPDTVFTVAPQTVQSATGHGLTFHTPLMTEEHEVNERMRGVAVDGRPADCVKLAIANIWPERFGRDSRPDVLISGMNDGANCGINVIYSGTVAAAIEAAFLGVPAIAVSMLRSSRQSRYDIGAYWARKTIDRLLARGIPRAHECLSINIPLTDAPGLSFDSPVPEVRVAPMNTHGLIDQYERRVNPSGAVYYWAAGHGLDFKGTEPESDVDLLLRNFITVTPLMYDLTRHDTLSLWKERLA